ncbi:MAG: hypothetical protein WC346_11990 [Methanogenium sp.]|jgi:very-short-patch-repair endonuclease
MPRLKPENNTVKRIFNYYHWKDCFIREYPLTYEEIQWLDSIKDELFKYPKRIGRAASLLTYCESLEEVVDLYNKGHITGSSVNTFISRYGYKEGTTRYDEYKKHLSNIHQERSKNENSYIKRTRSCFCEEYWTSRDLTSEEARETIKDIRLTISSKLTGRKWPGREFPNQINTWLNRGLNETEAKAMVVFYNKKCDTSLNAMMERHGNEKGEKLYHDMIAKRKVSIVKHFETNGVCWKKASKESLQYFIPLYISLRKNYGIDRSDIFFGIGGSSEYYLGGGPVYYYLYDFTILSKKLIIEYNGERWHPNPSMDEEKWKNWKSIGGSMADVQYEKDMKKKRCALDHGFKYLEIWSGDAPDNNWNKINVFLKENLC